MILTLSVRQALQMKDYRNFLTKLVIKQVFLSLLQIV